MGLAVTSLAPGIRIDMDEANLTAVAVAHQQVAYLGYVAADWNSCGATLMPSACTIEVAPSRVAEGAETLNPRL